jgi:hypothetical protein
MFGPKAKASGQMISKVDTFFLFLPLSFSLCLTHSFTHFLTHSLIHSLTPFSSLSHSLAPSLTCSSSLFLINEKVPAELITYLRESERVVYISQ